MIFLDLPLALILAGLLAHRSGGRATPAMLFSLLGIAIPGTLVVGDYPAWSWQYYVDPEVLPSGWPFVYAPAVLLAGWLGVLLGRRGVWYLVPVMFAHSIWNTVHFGELLHVGDLASFEADQAPLLPAPFLWRNGPPFAWFALLFVACWVWVGRTRAEPPEPEPEGQPPT